MKGSHIDLLLLLLHGLLCCCDERQFTDQFIADVSPSPPRAPYFLPPLSLLPPLSRSFCSQLYAKLQCIKAEIQDVNDEHVRSRQELEQTQNELTRELKFK